MRIFPGLLLLLWSFSALAEGPGAEDNERHFQNAAVTVGVPVALTQAIAGVESGGSPWALNVAGRGHIHASRDEALAAARRADAAGLSFDSGIMQINNWWLKRYGIPLEAMFDPAANILLGSWILRQELDRAGGDAWTAVARYHSPDANRGRRYADMVRRALERGPAQHSAAAPGRRGSGLAHAKREKNTKTATPAGQGSTTVRPGPGLEGEEETSQTFDRSAGTMPAAGTLVVYRQSYQQPVFTRTMPDNPEPERPVFVRRLP